MICNDGDLDLFVTNCCGEDNFFFINQGNGSFMNNTTSVITNDGKNSRSGSWADYDKDGDLDLLVANKTQNLFYKNKGNNNNWISIKLKGYASNSMGIQSVVEIKTSQGWQKRRLPGKFAKNGQNVPEVHFGLGQASQIDSLIVKWPSGIQQVLTNISVNQFITIEEAPNVNDIESCPGKVNLKAFGAPGNGSYLWYDSKGASSPLYTTSDTSYAVHLIQSKTFYVSIKVNNRESKRVPVNIKVLPAPNSDFSVNGNKLIAPSKTGYQYQWYYEGNKIANADARNSIYVISKSGNYKVVITNQQGCKDTSETKYVVYNSIEKVGEPFALIIYPNPSDGLLFVRSEKNPGSIRTLEVFNVYGDKVKHFANRKTLNGALELDLSSLTSGVYYLRANTPDIALIRKVFIK